MFSWICIMRQLISKVDNMKLQMSNLHPSSIHSKVLFLKTGVNKKKWGWHAYQSTQGSSISGTNTATLQVKMDVRTVEGSYRAFRPANGAWRRRGLNLEKRIRWKHFECEENSTTVFLSLARRKMSRKQGSASVKGLTHENEMFPKIKKGRSRGGGRGMCWTGRNTRKLLD